MKQLLRLVALPQQKSKPALPGNELAQNSLWRLRSQLGNGLAEQRHTLAEPAAHVQKEGKRLCCLVHRRQIGLGHRQPPRLANVVDFLTDYRQRLALIRTLQTCFLGGQQVQIITAVSLTQGKTDLAILHMFCGKLAHYCQHFIA